MSDILPKAKLYILISLFQLLINACAYVSGLMNELTFDFTHVIGDVLSSFLPFVSLVSLVILDLPQPLFLVLSLVTGIFSGVQAFILVMMGLQLISNLFYHPDV